MVRNYLKGFRKTKDPTGKLHSMAAQGISWKQYAPRPTRPKKARPEDLSMIQSLTPTIPETQEIIPERIVPQPQMAEAEVLPEPEMLPESQSSEKEARPIEERGTEVSHPPALLSYEEGILI